MAGKKQVAVIGAGLAGSEAAWQLAGRGIQVDLYEMRPKKMTEAHRSSFCAELVCSNSFKSLNLENAHGLLKEELRLQGSLILEAAERFALPAGQALAVDREPFSKHISSCLEAHSLISIKRKEIQNISELLSDYERILISTGPLTSESLSQDLEQLLGTHHLSFYDAIAPVVEAESIDYRKAFRASRYGKGEADYLNCPMNQLQYETFVKEIDQAEKVQLNEFEDVRPFEGCLPIEVMVDRGKDTLRYGPLKPVGLEHPESGESFHAVVQLRQENAAASLFNLVGFQTKMSWTAQKKVFRMIPGLEHAEFVRLGSIHRNTFINTPVVLSPRLNLKKYPEVYFAGQIIGVEGYIESTAMGLCAAHQIDGDLKGFEWKIPEPETMCGALIRYITESDPKHFQPMNANFGLLDPPKKKMPKSLRKAWFSQRALNVLRKSNPEMGKQDFFTDPKMKNQRTAVAGQGRA